MTELIQKTDSLNKGREKLNEAIASANTAVTTASAAQTVAAGAVTTANESKTQSTSVQTQLNTIVIASGTSDAETLQARTDRKGALHTTLKDRLDKFELTMAQLSFVNVKDFGAIGDGVADDSNAVKAAITYCISVGKGLFFPDGTYLLKLITLGASAITACKLYGESMNGVTIVLDGYLYFNTTALTDMAAENITFELHGHYLTKTDLESTRVSVFHSTTNKQTFSYKNLTFNGVVDLEDGTQRYFGAIRDGCNKSGAIENITTDNVANAVAILGGSDNYKVHDLNATNFQTGVWSQGTNYVLETLRGINTMAQALVWIQQTHATTPRVMHNGMDLALCYGSDYRLIDLDAKNPIERCVYSQGSNVVADKLYASNCDGFKFCGLSYGEIVTNVEVSNAVFEVTEDLIANGRGGVNEFTLYWIDGVKISNTISRDLTTAANIIAGVRVNRHVKNVTLDNMHTGDVGVSFIYANIRDDAPETVLTTEDCIILDNVKVRNCTVKKNYRYPGSLLYTRTLGGHATALANYAIRDISFDNCHVTYGTNKDDFWYDWSYCDGFFAKNNGANTQTYFNSGFLNVNPTICKNIVLIERDIRMSSASTLFGALATIKLTKGSELYFSGGAAQREFRAQIVVKNALTTELETPVTISSGSYLEASFDLDPIYASYTAFPANYIAEVVTAGGDYCLSKVVGTVKTDIVGTPVVTLTPSAGQLDIRGEWYDKPFRVLIKSLMS